MSALGRAFTISVLLPLLLSCQEDGRVATDADGAPDLLADERRECERSGGNWGLRAGDSLFVCFRETRDANQRCSIASDCEGMCLARSQTCSPIEPFLGCHEILTEGGARATQCVN